MVKPYRRLKFNEGEVILSSKWLSGFPLVSNIENDSQVFKWLYGVTSLIHIVGGFNKAASLSTKLISKSTEHFANEMLEIKTALNVIKSKIFAYPISVLGKLFLLGEKCFKFFSMCLIFILKSGFIFGLDVFDAL